MNPTLFTLASLRMLSGLMCKAAVFSKYQAFFQQSSSADTFFRADDSQKNCMLLQILGTKKKQEY